MQQFITNFGATTEHAAEEAGLFEALGIDWRLLILQVIAFAVLVWFLGKFVYPVLIRALDKREAAIEESLVAAKEAETKAEQSEAEVEKLLKQARKEATEIVDLAHKEAQQQVKEAEDRAKSRGDQIIADAREQLDRDVTKAREALRSDVAGLVALATEKVVREKVDASKDKSLIDAAIKEAA
jgi:F-type H+-transporting ATPase subunit b